MKRIVFLSAVLLSLFACQRAGAQDNEWTTAIKGKVNVKAHKLPDMIHKALDFSAGIGKVNGEPHLIVYLRNGHHKMGATSIELQYGGTATNIQVGRIQIAKPMSVISKKTNGRHLFETFVEKGKTYEIFYTVKNAKLAPKISIKLKGAQQ